MSHFVDPLPPLTYDIIYGWPLIIKINIIENKIGRFNKYDRKGVYKELSQTAVSFTRGGRNEILTPGSKKTDEISFRH